VRSNLSQSSNIEGSAATETHAAPVVHSGRKSLLHKTLGDEPVTVAGEHVSCPPHAQTDPSAPTPERRHAKPNAKAGVVQSLNSESLVLRHGHVRGAKVRLLQRVAEPRSDFARRVLSFTVAVIGLIITAPLMVVLALLIKLTSPGPIFFTQVRVGLDRRRGERRRGRPQDDCRREGDVGGRPFRIYKFRTMTEGKNPNSQLWASADDPRITRLGGVLRKFRLDELPQLINVLKGEMNIVGPRPEQPKIFAELRQRISGYSTRQRARPGITGWAQINQHYDQDLRDVRRKVTYDVEYVHRQSVREDLKIMLHTLPVMLFRKGSR